MEESFYGPSAVSQVGQAFGGAGSEAPPAPAQQIVIRKVLNGYIAECGCQQVVFENKDRMLKELSRYFDNPAKVAAEYLKKGGK